MVNFWDKSPASAQIALWVGGGQPGEKGTTQFGTYSTNADGSFNIKSNAQWNGDDYKLVVSSGNNTTGASCTVAKHKSVDVGDIVTGDFTFKCKVNLHSVSGASISLIDIGTTSQATSYSAGTNTIVTASKTYDYSLYQVFGNFYHIGYKLSTSTADSNIFVPLHQPTDTTSVTINY